MASTGRAERGQVRGRENCTLRRFRIRGLIEGMLRTLMGNICRKKVTGQRSPGGERKERRMKKKGEGYGGTREIEHQSGK